MKPSSPSIQKQLNLAPVIRMIVPATILEEFSDELSESQFFFIHILTSKATESAKEFHSLRLDFLVKQLGSKPRERQIQGLIDMGVVAVQTNREGKETYEPCVLIQIIEPRKCPPSLSSISSNSASQFHLPQTYSR